MREWEAHTQITKVKSSLGRGAKGQGRAEPSICLGLRLNVPGFVRASLALVLAPRGHHKAAHLVNLCFDSLGRVKIRWEGLNKAHQVTLFWVQGATRIQEASWG